MTATAIPFMEIMSKKYIALGRILEQRRMVRESIRSAKEANAELASAKEDARGWPSMEAASFADAEVSRAKTRQSARVSTKIAADRRLKRLKYEFKEAYPEFDLANFLANHQ